MTSTNTISAADAPGPQHHAHADLAPSRHSSFALNASTANVFFIDQDVDRQRLIVNRLPGATICSTAAVAMHLLTLAANNGGLPDIVAIDSDETELATEIIRHLVYLAKNFWKINRVILHGARIDLAVALAHDLSAVPGGADIRITIFNSPGFWQAMTPADNNTTPAAP